MAANGAKVLVVDDQRSMRLTLSGIVEDQGYTVTEVEDGYQAIEAASATAFDLVFMDPPYAEVDRAGTLETLVASAILSDQSMVVVERPTGHPLPPVTGLRVLEERRYGDTTLTWLARADRVER